MITACPQRVSNCTNINTIWSIVPQCHKMSDYWELSNYLPWLYSPLLDLCRFFSFFISYKVGRTIWTGDQPVARPLPIHRTAQTQNKHTQTSKPQVGFEPTISVFEWTKTVHDRPRGHCDRLLKAISLDSNQFCLKACQYYYYNQWRFIAYETQ
jgi:hypothetical protein